MVKSSSDSNEAQGSESRVTVSGGLDTYASVPAFFPAAYWPVQAQKFGVNLFELGHRQGFKAWYLSAQTLNFLKAAGGAPHAERASRPRKTTMGWQSSLPRCPTAERTASSSYTSG